MYFIFFVEHFSTKNSVCFLYHHFQCCFFHSNDAIVTEVFHKNILEMFDAKEGLKERFAKNICLRV